MKMQHRQATKRTHKHKNRHARPRYSTHVCGAFYKALDVLAAGMHQPMNAVEEEI